MMAKTAAAITETDEAKTEESQTPEIDSKYRMIIVAAQRSRQLQKGARPRIEMDSQRHKPTRIALEEALQGRVEFLLTEMD
ncbi:MAG: DNA-directed RNA polymerase subunit omega [Acidobacteria bacterium]|nr:DNA-directed RNA polymerase subunit omega [Acidobacteriota bacterium]